MSVTLDYIQDATVRDDSTGLTVVRRARVRGVAGGLSAQRRALEAPGLPRKGESHPSWSDLKLVDILLQPLDPGLWDATLTYRIPTASDRITTAPDGTVIEREWFAATVTEDQTRDVDDEPMYHWYTGKPLEPKIVGSSVTFSPTLTSQLIWKQESAEIQRPSLGARVTTVDAESIQDMAEFSGHINSSIWSGYPAETWLLGGLNSREEQGRWINTFEFFYKPDTWKFRSAVEYFGAVPSDATEGNGIAFFNVYPRANFSVLGFSL